MESYLENHCGKSGCMCTHTEGCEKGFIWVEYYEDDIRLLPDGSKKVKSVKREGVRFCHICDPERARIQQTARNGFELGEKLRALSKHNRKLAYEENESSRTRTL